MVHPAARLVAACRATAADPELQVEFELSREARDEGELARLIRLFATYRRFPCPPPLQPGLLLPGRLVLAWRCGEVGGEIDVVDVMAAMDRLVDVDLADTVVDGRRLGDLRVIDQVVREAGPYFTVVQIEGGVVVPQLLFTDLREVLPLELDYGTYLEKAALTRGILRWQELFLNVDLKRDAIPVLRAGLALLHDRFPAPGLDDLEARLRARS